MSGRKLSAETNLGVELVAMGLKLKEAAHEAEASYLALRFYVGNLGGARAIRNKRTKDQFMSKLKGADITSRFCQDCGRVIDGNNRFRCTKCAERVSEFVGV